MIGHASEMNEVSSGASNSNAMEFLNSMINSPMATDSEKFKKKEVSLIELNSSDFDIFIYLRKGFMMNPFLIICILPTIKKNNTQIPKFSLLNSLTSSMKEEKLKIRSKTFFVKVINP